MHHPQTSICAAALLLFWTPPLLAQDYEETAIPLAFSVSSTGAQDVQLVKARPDAHAPIGVLGDHLNEPGQWTFSYRYFRSGMSGLRDGRGDVTAADVFAAGFQTAPRRMVEEEHLFSALYGYSEAVSVLATLPWINRELVMTDTGGSDFTQRTIGLGDVQVRAIYSLQRSSDEELHLDMGVSLPTGSRDEKEPSPGSGGVSVKLPYVMQLGTGTVDLSPGLTYLRTDENTSWGAQGIQVMRLTDNSDDYRLGNETTLSTWVSRKFKDDLSSSLRLSYHHTGKIRGRDDEIDPEQAPTGDPTRYGGDAIQIFAGINYTMPGGHTFAGELGGPIWQDLNGPQLETDIIYALGWRVSF